MKYPKYIENRKAEILKTIASWPIEKNIAEVFTWLLQFDSTDYDLAIRIINNLNVIGADELNSALAISYSKLLRHANERGVKISKENTIYIPFGSAGKSGAMIAYNFRLINGLNSAYFLSKDTIGLIKEGQIKNLVLIDDIIASGDQSSGQVKEIAEKALSLGISNIFVITAFGFKEGISKVSETELIDVFSAIEYDKCDTVQSLDADFYNGIPYDKRKSYMERLTNNYKGLGYNGIGALITFFYNTPNCTLNSVWNNNNGWIPLFPRKHDLNNKAPELYEFEELLKEDEKDIKVEKNDLSIYVEGKTVELFLSEMAKRNNDFGFPGLKIVSIGPFYQKSLIDILSKFSEKVLFITDDDNDKEDNIHNRNMRDAVGDKPLLTMGSIISYFDMKKIADNPNLQKILDQGYFDENTPLQTKYTLIETRLFKRAVANYRFSNMQELLDNCADTNKIDELKSQIIEKTK